MSMQLRFSYLIILLSLSVGAGRLGAQGSQGSQSSQNLQNSQQHEQLGADALRAIDHKDPTWLIVQPHLPDPTTASPETLETAGDVLRARRFPQDALDYYTYALQRGGKQVELLNKMGVTELELWHVSAARMCFQRAVKLKKKNSDGWNNLGAVEYLDGRFQAAISDYSKAIKLNQKSATYHSNLGTAYLEQKDYGDARKQYQLAMTLDPNLFEHHGLSGVTAHMLTTEDHARFCYEMARLYVQQGDEVNTLHFLAQASEGGFDIVRAMASDPAFINYRKDPRVAVIVQNAQALRNIHASIGQGPGGIPPLPSESQHE